MRRTDIAESLFQSLAVEATDATPGRTEQTATVETIDRDRVRDLMLGLGIPVTHSGMRDRTEETRTIETIDQDRIGPRRPRCLEAAREDLYRRLAGQPAAWSGPGRTELTESTETIDWDRPPRRR